VIAKCIYDQSGVGETEYSLYWRLLDKRGSSEHLRTTCTAIAPVLELLSDYEVVILGDREFGSVSSGILALIKASEVYYYTTSPK